MDFQGCYPQIFWSTHECLEDAIVIAESSWKTRLRTVIARVECNSGRLIRDIAFHTNTDLETVAHLGTADRFLERPTSTPTPSQVPEGVDECGGNA